MSELLRGLGLTEREVARVLDAFATRDLTVATAESLTSGLVCAALTCVPGASAVVRGGLVVYATELKSMLAGVDADLLAERGAVDPEVAGQLATGAARHCGADYGVGLTGVAGPSWQDGVAPGTVHIAIAGPHGCHQGTHTLTGGREEVRAAAVRAAIRRLGGILDVVTEGTTEAG
ncbi:CinA family protein [Sciscionella marina]|uniref:CinA family protein n=1 Tax=Sciscionella marina TaxID=508770 RepID=UPI0003821DFE|nr:CinA family protein [Sciscionella marina]